jgi:hypothetical protein
MDDPLGTSPFASAPTLPAWPSTPHTPNSPGPQPTLPRPASPLPPSQIVAGPYGREPQIYGQPTPGLISPQVTTAANGSKFERDGQYLRVRITGLDRNRRDIIVKIDAQVACSMRFLDLAYPVTCRQTCRTLLAQLTGIYRVPMSSFSVLQSRLHTVTHRQSFQRFLSHKRRLHLMKKVSSNVRHSALLDLIIANLR